MDKPHTRLVAWRKTIGSPNGLATQLEVAQRIGYIDATSFRQVESELDECLAVTYGLRKSLK